MQNRRTSCLPTSNDNSLHNFKQRVLLILCICTCIYLEWCYYLPLYMYHHHEHVCTHMCLAWFAFLHLYMYDDIFFPFLNLKIQFQFFSIFGNFPTLCLCSTN